LPHVLLIDDDPAVSMTLSRMLAAAGHRVTVVESASHGLAAVLTEVPDAILLDIRMPEIGGLDFLRSLRADARFTRIPVAVVTGDYFLKDDDLGEIQTLAAGISYKPLGLDDLESVLAKLFGPSGPSSVATET
jgi:CheY-like chemotaxis protein